MQYFRAYLLPEKAIITPIEPLHVTTTEAIFEDGSSIPLKCGNGCVAPTFKEAKKYLQSLFASRIKKAKDIHFEELQSLNTLRKEIESMKEGTIA